MINFYTEDTSFKYHGRILTREWLNSVANQESKRIKNISVIFCSDPYILDINKKFLGHDYFTDIITFDYSSGDSISGDLFISVDSVMDNSSFYGTTFIDELHRVIVHGILHLIGYDDHTDVDISVMRSKENAYLLTRPVNMFSKD